MKFYFLKDTADANIKGCGLWVHFRTTLIGIAPNWWYRDRSGKRPQRRLGFNIFTPAPYYDRFAFFTIEFGRRRFGIVRDRIGGPVRIGAPQL